MVKPVPEVVAVLERWRPATWNERDLQTLEPLLPTVRGWVKQMDLSNAHKTRGLLRAASGIAVWALPVVWQRRPNGGVPLLKHRNVDDDGPHGQIDQVARNHPQPGSALSGGSSIPMGGPLPPAK